MTHISQTIYLSAYLEVCFMDECQTTLISQCDAMIDLIINVGHRDLISWSSDFASYFKECFMDVRHTLGL